MSASRKLQKFIPSEDSEIDREHEKIGNKPQFNNYFINVVKNLGANLLMNCQAQSLYMNTGLYLKKSNSRLASMITVTLWSLLVCERTDMFDKLLVTQHMRKTQVQGSYRGLSSRFCGVFVEQRHQGRRRRTHYRENVHVQRCVYLFLGTRYLW